MDESIIAKYCIFPYGKANGIGILAPGNIEKEKENKFNEVYKTLDFSEYTEWDTLVSQYESTLNTKLLRFKLNNFNKLLEHFPILQRFLKL